MLINMVKVWTFPELYVTLSKSASKLSGSKHRVTVIIKLYLTLTLPLTVSWTADFIPYFVEFRNFSRSTASPPWQPRRRQSTQRWRRQRRRADRLGSQSPRSKARARGVCVGAVPGRGGSAGVALSWQRSWIWSEVCLFGNGWPTWKGVFFYELDRCGGVELKSTRVQYNMCHRYLD